MATNPAAPSYPDLLSRLRAVPAAYRAASTAYAAEQAAADKRVKDQAAAHAAAIKAINDDHAKQAAAAKASMDGLRASITSFRSRLMGINMANLVTDFDRANAGGLGAATSDAEAGKLATLASDWGTGTASLVSSLEGLNRSRERSRRPGVIWVAVISGILSLAGFYNALTDLQYMGAAYFDGVYPFVMAIIGCALLASTIGLIARQRWGWIVSVVTVLCLATVPIATYLFGFERYIGFLALAANFFDPFLILISGSSFYSVYGLAPLAQSLLFGGIAIYLLRKDVRQAFPGGMATKQLAIRGRVNTFNSAIARAKDWYTACLGRIDQEQRTKTAAQELNNTTRVAAITNTNQQALSAALAVYDSALADLRGRLQAINGALGLDAAAWTEPAWRSWAPAEAGKVPIARIGALTEVAGRAAGHEALLQGAPPAPPFPILMGERLLIESPTPAQTGATTAVQSLLARLLATIPPAKLHFTFIDPVGSGNSVAGFMALADYDDRLVNGMAWSDPDKIEQRLAGLAEHMRNVIQKYLRDVHPSIVEYNAQAVVPEAYRVLVVFDFPANFTERAARDLVSIAANGPRCGVYPIIVADPSRPMPYGIKMDDLRVADTTILTWDGGRWVSSDPAFRDSQIALDPAPPTALTHHVVETVGQMAKAANVVEVPFATIAPPPDRWWTGDAADGLAVPLGPSGANKLQPFELGRGTEQHALIVGKTGSGKSTLLHDMIMNLALTYGPDEVQMYLVDFKKGVEFKPYAVHQLPHARVIAIQGEREFGLSVLTRLNDELAARGELFRANNVDELAMYRRRTGQKLPRVILLVDEFQELFSEEDGIASQAAQILDRLVRQGRAFGIHVVLGSQSLAGAYMLARPTIDQMAVRIALQCGEADSRLILAEDNDGAILLSRPGEAIYNAANGQVEGNMRFQAAWLPNEELERYVVALRQKAGRPPTDQIVFEGNALVEVTRNTQLAALLAAPGWPAPAPARPAWIGEPVAIRDSVAATFRRQSGNNLLIVGQSPDAALAMARISLVSLAAGLVPVAARPGGPALFTVLDFSPIDGPTANAFAGLAADLPHEVRVGRRRQTPDAIAEIAAEVRRRLEGDEHVRPTPIYLYIYGLHQARDLRPDDMPTIPPYGSTEPPAPSLAEQFAGILRDGPEVGVHTIVWCDTFTNLERALDHRALREFAMRVAFQMSAEDSSRLIDTPHASKLGPHRALFLSEDEGRLEKFRPYAPPSDEWLRGAGEALRRKR